MSEPFPVSVPGESQIIATNRIGSYYDAAFTYYYTFYMQCRHCGLPYSGGWADQPSWVPQLILHFDTAVELIKNHNIRKSMKGHG